MRNFGILFILLALPKEDETTRQTKQNMQRN